MSCVEQLFALANHIPVIRPSGRPTAVQNRSRRFCADQLEAKVATAQARIDRLTQSLLANAFTGERVPQAPNDEPASVLLKRIARRLPAPRPAARPAGVPWRSLRQGQAQRAAAPKAKRGRKASA